MLTDSWRRVAKGHWTQVLNQGNEVFGGAGDDFLAGDRGNDRLDGGSCFDSGAGGYYDGVSTGSVGRAHRLLREPELPMNRLLDQRAP